MTKMHMKLYPDTYSCISLIGLLFLPACLVDDTEVGHCVLKLFRCSIFYAFSNFLVNLSSLSHIATVFGELWRLEPLASQKKAMWRREMEWLLSISDSIVELVPSVQEFPGGSGVTFEVMVPRPRSDLCMNLPALKKLDAMLISILEGFKVTEFWYVERGICVADADEDGSGPYLSRIFL
jgi:PRONE (Plant-specific Rop nucleotide exchanger)